MKDGASRTIACPGCEPRTWELGAIDRAFVKGKHPATLELLVRLRHVLELSSLIDALRRALAGSDCAWCGHRVGTQIVAGHGVRIAHSQVPAHVLRARPVPSCLFERLRVGKREDGNEVLALKVATSAGIGSTLGLTWDHAFCDVGGAALFLSRLSACYGGQAPTPPPLHHERQLQQALLVQSLQSAVVPRPHRESGMGRRAGNDGDGGAIATLVWEQTAASLEELRVSCAARSRHEALFAHVIALLRAAGHAVATASVSRNGRGRGSLPTQHVGNGALIVESQLPPPPASRLQLAAALRAAIDGDPGVAQLRVPADVHFTSWWHPLQVRVGVGARACVDARIRTRTRMHACTYTRACTCPRMHILTAGPDAIWGRHGPRVRHRPHNALCGRLRVCQGWYG